MSYRLSGINPLAYVGVEPLTPPQMIVQSRSPNDTDSKGYNLGTYWLVAAPPPTMNWELWILVDLTGGIATWVQLFPSGSAGVIRLDADVGFAIPTLGIINVLGGENINTFGDMSNNLFINLNESIHLPNTSSDGSQGVLFLGSTGGVGGDTFLHNYGTNNTWLGINAGNLTLTVGSATGNTGIGEGVLHEITTGSANSSLGAFSQSSLTTGDLNTSLGAASLSNLVSGSDNIAIGQSSASTFTTNESNNIIIGSPGVIADQDTIRIGVEATQTAAYIAGIFGRSVGVTNQTVIIDNTGKLGSITNPLPGGIIITTFDSSGTWNKNPDTKLVKIIMLSGGSGGGSGAQGLTFASPQCSTGGGGGSSGSATITDQMLASFFNASESVIVGAGGIGGVSQVAPNTAGNDGTAGGISTFANLGIFSGGPGRGGLINNVTGGNGPNSTNIAYNYGTSFTGFVNISGNVSSVPGSGRANTGNNGLSLGGTPGGVSTSGTSQWTGTEGGGGGGADITTAWAGGNGGDVNTVSVTSPVLLVSGGAGGIETGTINGANGVDFATPTGYFWFAGTGGGGGGGQSSGLVAGNGGNGGIPSGGGGGGGASLNGTPSGAGGNGAHGRVIVIEYL